MGFVQTACDSILLHLCAWGKWNEPRLHKFLPRISAEAFFPFPLELSSGDSEKTGPKSTVEAL